MMRKAFVEGLGGWLEHGGTIEPIGDLGDDETLLRRMLEHDEYEIIEEVLGYHRSVIR